MTRAHFNPKVFEVPIYAPIKNCDCNEYSFKYLYNFEQILAKKHYFILIDKHYYKVIYVLL